MKKFVVLLFVIVLLLSFSVTGQATDIDSDNYRFIVIGDTRPSFTGAPFSPAYMKILEEINWINPDFVIHTGDLIFGYGESGEILKDDYGRALELLSMVNPKIYYVPGNHDYQSPEAADYFSQLSGYKDGYYSFNAHGATFIILNTDIPGQLGQITGEQREWLEKTLLNAKDAKAIFVFMHRPLFSFLVPDEDQRGDIPESDCNFISKKAKNDLLDLITKYPITAVIAGHEHLFYHTEYKGIPFYTIGGGGAPFSTSPEKGGFFHYLIVNVNNDDISYKIMEPYHFSVDTKVITENGVSRGEALIHNIDGELQSGLIQLNGIKFTLPQGDYSVKIEPAVTTEQLVKVGKATGLLKESTSLGTFSQLLKLFEPTFFKVEPHPQNNQVVSVSVGVNALGSLPIRVTVQPKDSSE